jgi:hypothetical protein
MNANSKPAWTTKIASEPKRLPPRVLIYGRPKIGKTTLALSIPGAVLLNYDDGADTYKGAKITPPKSWAESLDLIRAIGSEPGPFSALAIDTIDVLEQQAIRHVCEEHKKKTLSEFGYGGGYEALVSEWRVLISALDAARRNGMIALLCAHSQSRTQNDPQVGEYDAYEPLMQKKTWSQTLKWCDLIGFANYDIAKAENRGIVTGERLLFVTQGTGYTAGNRWGLPQRLPLSWKAITDAIAATEQEAATVRARIVSMSAGTEYAARAEEFLRDAGDDVKRLLSIEEALKTKLSEVTK